MGKALTAGAKVIASVRFVQRADQIVIVRFGDPHAADLARSRRRLPQNR